MRAEPPADATPPLAPPTDPAPRWKTGPTVVFAAMLATLLAMALWGWRAPITRPAGMPDDPEVERARAALGGPLPLPVPGWSLTTAFAGASRPTTPDSLPLARLARAEGHLQAAAVRHRGDVRLDLALAHLELADGRFERAARDYRAVLERAPHAGEARVGLGIALVARAGWREDGTVPESGRGPALEALAQFTNVDRDDPASAAATFDRVRLLRALGRPAKT